MLFSLDNSTSLRSTRWPSIEYLPVANLKIYQIFQNFSKKKPWLGDDEPYPVHQCENLSKSRPSSAASGKSRASSIAGGTSTKNKRRTNPKKVLTSTGAGNGTESPRKGFSIILKSKLNALKTRIYLQNCFKHILTF